MDTMQDLTIGLLIIVAVFLSYIASLFTHTAHFFHLLTSDFIFQITALLLVGLFRPLFSSAGFVTQTLLSYWHCILLFWGMVYCVLVVRMAVPA